MTGFSVLPTHIVRDGSVELAAKAILLVLSSYTDGDNECWPSISSIAADVGLSKRQTQRLLKRLEQEEYIVVVRRYDSNKPKVQLSNTFRLNFNRWGSDEKQREMTDVSGGIRQICQGGGDAHDTQGVTPTSPKQYQLTKPTTPTSLEVPPTKRKSSVAQKPPSPEDVGSYFVEMGGSKLDAQNFYDYWSDMGWRRKAGPMRDWRGSARTWHRRSDRGGPVRKVRKADLPHDYSSDPSIAGDW